MLRISALNESGGSGSDTDSGQVETREAQEANLLNLYTNSLKNLSNKNVRQAKENLLEIINSSIFQEQKEESLALSLKYNVHKNLGECYLLEGDIERAQEEMLIATEIDAGDVTLWFKIAGTAVKLKNLYMCRSALEQGLKACPNHWPSIDNLITVTFKLNDFLACLGYCAMAEEIDPKLDKIVLYKSKIYNEMPFLQEAYGDTNFKPIHTEIETFNVTMVKEPPREPIKLDVQELTLECLAHGIYELSEYCDTYDTALNPVDTASAVTRLQEAKQKQEEMKIRVSVQNVVDEIIDIIEEEEEIIACCEEILDEMLCDMFGVEPRPVSERVASHIVDILVDNVFDPVKKKSVTIEPKPRERKRVNAFDEIPQELIEKRRSSRKAKYQELAQSTETSSDPVKIQTPKELLESFVPAVLKSSKGYTKINSISTMTGKPKLDAEGNAENEPSKSAAAKSLFGEKKRIWFSKEEEKAEVEKFLADNSGKTIWHLMRAFLDYIFRLDNNLIWPKDLVTWSGKVYQCWRLHLADPLCIENPEEIFTQEFLRYYILGSECIIGTLLDQEIERETMPLDISQRLHQDLEELYTIYGHLTIDLKLRVHSLRFFYFSIVEDEDEVLYETGQLLNIYSEHPDIPIFSSLPQYKIATKKRLEEYSKGISLNKELEELNHYYESEKYEEIVKLVLNTLESNKFTPTKECSRVPDRETQIDILIESLLHTHRFAKCIEWSTKSLAYNLEQMLVDVETGKARKMTSQDLEIINSYLDIINSCVENSDTKDFGETSLEIASSLAAILLQLIEIQLNDTTPQTVLSLPWILLHKLLLWTETKYQMKDETNTDVLMPGSLSLLCSAHDYLGQKSCCTVEKGMLLNYCLDIFIPIMIQPSLPRYSDQIKTNLDQALYCLYAHPSKKSRNRHLADHNVSQVALVWERAQLIYRYLRPDKVPEHDDVKLLSISADCENFMKRVVALIPESVCIHKRRITAEEVVQGKKERPRVKKFKSLPPDLKDLFYLLADYAFKNSMDLERALDLYTLDISFNPDRYESWAALALTLANMMDKRLNSCKKLNPVKMLESFESVKNCFDRYIESNDGNSNIFIEYANFNYNFQSYISRTLNNDSENMTLDLFGKLEKTKEGLYKAAMKNYKLTLDIFDREGIQAGDVDERWLVHYMIGKIKEKTNSGLLDSLDCYLTSIKYLEKNEAVLPKKINYNSPQTWSVECLEVYYRVHASILKYLVKYETNLDGVDLETKRKLYDVLKTVQLNKIYTANAYCDKNERFPRKRKLAGENSEEKNKEARLESTTTIMKDVIEVLDNCVDEVEFALDPTRVDVPSLINICLLGLEDVALHFLHHFKSVYRLAHYYYNSTVNKDLAKVERLVLAGEKDKNVKFPGLFFGRKPNQVFNEIWRIPINEIDRPGSFAAHCAKCLMLLLDVVRTLPDLTILTDIAIQMRKPPSEENKFVHDSDRIEIKTIASTYLFNTIKARIASADVDKTSLLLDLQKIYIKLIKQWNGKEKDVMLSMKELYCKIKGRSETDKISNEEVLRFCTTETKIRQGKAVPIPVQQQHNATAATSTTATKSSTLLISNQAKQTGSSGSTVSATARKDIIKDYSQISAFIQKICACMDAVAMNQANLTFKDILTYAGLKFEEQQVKMNSLLQQLCMMSKPELTAIAIDQNTLVKLTTYAIKIGISLTAVTNHLTRIKSILDETYKIPPKSMASSNSISKPNQSSISKASVSNFNKSTGATKPPVITINSQIQNQLNSTNIQESSGSKNPTVNKVSGNDAKKAGNQKQTTSIKQTTKFKTTQSEKEQYLKKMQEIMAIKNMYELAQSNAQVVSAAQLIANSNAAQRQSVNQPKKAKPSQANNSGAKQKKTAALQQVSMASGLTSTATKNLAMNSQISITSTGNSTKQTQPSTSNNANSSSNQAASRILNLPAGVTLTHITSKQPEARTNSPAMARVISKTGGSNPGSRSSSPKSMVVSAASANNSRTSSPALFGAANKGVAADKSKGAAAQKGPDAAKKATNQLAVFKAQMMKSLQVSGGLQQNKKKATQVASAGNKQTVVTNKPSASKPITPQASKTSSVIAKPQAKPSVNKMAEATFKQDLPPKGGYAPINFKRIPARRVLNAPIIYGALFGSMAIGHYIYLRGKARYTKDRIEWRSSELALEPLMLAERDREFLKQCRRNRDAETELMKDVEGWEVGTWYGHKVYKTLGDKWIDPDINDFYGHCSPRQITIYKNHAQHLRSE